jgi:hypothetical protein
MDVLFSVPERGEIVRQSAGSMMRRGGLDGWIDISPPSRPKAPQTMVSRVEFWIWI